MFVTKQDCERVGKEICNYINNIPLTAIQNGRRYTYDSSKGIVYVERDGRTLVILENEGTDWQKTYNKLKSMDSTVFLLRSLAS